MLKGHKGFSGPQITFTDKSPFKRRHQDSHCIFLHDIWAGKLEGDREDMGQP